MSKQDWDSGYKAALDDDGDGSPSWVGALMLLGLFLLGIVAGLIAAGILK